MKLILTQGIPGSGKSTWARAQRDANPIGTVIISADDYFMHRGNYEFSIGELTCAHRHCFAQAILHLSGPRFSTTNTLIVHNTNLSNVEMSPYIMLAKASYWNVEIRRFPIGQEVAFKRQTHGVPQETHLAMALKFAQWEPEGYWVSDGGITILIHLQDSQE